MQLNFDWNQLTSLEFQQILFTLFLATASIWAGLQFCSRRKESTQSKEDLIVEFPKLPDDVVSYKKTKIFDEVNIYIDCIFHLQLIRQ